MKIALIHDWLTGMRGGEKCLEIFCELFPDATLMSLLHLKGTMSPTIEKMDIQTSFIQKLPFLKTKYRHYLPLFPTAIEDFDLKGYDLVLSSSHCVAKGVLTHPGTMHFCYCHTPMRYVWSMYHDYFGQGRVKGLQKMIIRFSSNYLRMWDVISANRVDYFIANSNHVRKRIEKYYQREAEVIHPPVDTSKTWLSAKNDDYYLVVTALVPYKRIDVAVKAFNQLNKRLVIVGQGSEEKYLKKIAGKNIEFVGWAVGTELQNYYANCKALIFPGEEDFGIVPVEAQAFGKPVIALGVGGALETVIGIWPANDGNYSPQTNEQYTGVFFSEPATEPLIKAVEFFERINFSKELIRQHALQFDKELFRQRIKSFIEEKSGVQL
ncbi:glycosyltransferase [candidate division KSB1 bacterium]|nr:glycosyltransferase [candidate division KSB1 bacterium]